MDIFGKIQSGRKYSVLVTMRKILLIHAHSVVRLRDGMIETDKSARLMASNFL
jgi:putative ABC transport system ATP-binding protein